MSDSRLSPKLIAKVHELFPPDEVPLVAVALEAQCGSGLPLIASLGAHGIDRIRCAVLKLSRGSLEDLLSSIRMANADWRNVLVASGFAEDALLHLSWLDNREQKS